MALNIGDNFNYAGAKPLDNRRVVASKAALDAVSLSTVYEGMVAYATLEDKYYRLKDGAWIEFSTGSASLPIASASTLGGIKVGNGLEIKSDGTLSATASPDNSVVAWTAGDSYNVGQYVVYDNNMYECITANSDSTFDADKWQLIGESSSEIKITDWKSGTSYSVGDLVLYNYTLYQCTAGNSDSTFDETSWTAIGNVDEGISEWVSGTTYSVGNIVVYDSKIYKCTTANSDTTFDVDKWAELGDSGNVQAWVSGTAYEVDDFVIYNNRLYQCLVANSDTTFDEDNWSDLGTIQKTVETWTSGKSYSVGDIVIYGKAIYKCTTANSDATFTPANWSVEIDNDKSVTAWVAGTSYTVGKYVVYDNRIWECTVANSDTTFTEAHWQEISPATGIVLEAWATSKSYKVNQFVEHNTHAYMCLASHTSGVFATDYDNGNWRQVSFDEFTGATATTDGEKGIVPQPTKTDFAKFLCGDGTWKAAIGGAGLSVIETVLWEGALHSAVTASSPEILTDDFSNYDYLLFVPGWINQGDVVVNEGRVLDTSVTPIWKDEAKNNPCASFSYGMSNKIASTKSIRFSFDFTEKTSFFCYVSQVNNSSGGTICLMKIVGINLVNSNDYSTDEKRIGTWIDGKPLYQKTIQCTTPSATGKNTSVYEFSDVSVDMVVEIFGYCYAITSNGRSVPYINSNRGAGSEYIYVYYRERTDGVNSRLQMQVGNAVHTNCPCYITVRYTKTTD